MPTPWDERQNDDLLNKKDSNLNPASHFRECLALFLYSVLLCAVTPYPIGSFEPTSLELITPEICGERGIRTVERVS